MTLNDFLYKKPKETIEKTNKLFIIAYAIFILWFLQNGPAVLPYWDASWSWAVLFYVVMLAMLDVVALPPKMIETHWQDIISAFIVVFLICTVGIFAAMRDINFLFGGIQSMQGYQVISHFVFTIGIVACAEEIIFRGKVVGALEKRVAPVWVYIISSAIFSIFHVAAYGMTSWFPFVQTFILGNILLFLTRKYNIGAAIGLHAAWNLYVMGVTALSIGVI